MVEKEKRGRGRPPLSNAEKKSTVTVSLRMDRELRESLEEDALRQDKTVNKEIVDRLKVTLSQGGYIDNWVFGDPQTHNLMRLIGMMVRNLHNSEFEELWDNPEVHKELVEAVMTVLSAFGPDCGIPDPTVEETPGQRRGRSWLNQAYKARILAERSADERRTENGEFVDYTVDEYAMLEIWKGLGPLAEKLEAKDV